MIVFVYLFVWTETDRKDEEKEGEDKSQPRSIRDRRRPREKRRSTGVSFWTQDVRDSQITFITVISIPSARRRLLMFPFDRFDKEGLRSGVTLLSFFLFRVMKMTLTSSPTQRRAAPRESHR